MDVAGADDGDIVRNPQPRFQHGFDRARRHRVVIAEDAVGRRCQPQQLAHGLIARDILVLAAHHVFRHRCEPMPGKRAPVSPQPARARRNQRTSNMRYPAASLFDQMLGGHRADFLVLHPHEIRLEARRRAVDHHIRRLPIRQGPEKVSPAVGLRRRDDQAIHAPSQQKLHLALFYIRILIRVRDDDLVIQRLEFPGHSLGHFGEKRMHQVRDNQADHVGPARYQAARNPIWPVIQFPRALHHARSRLFADIAVAAQGLGDGHEGDPQVASDIDHSGAHMSVGRTPSSAPDPWSGSCRRIQRPTRASAAVQGDRPTISSVPAA